MAVEPYGFLVRREPVRIQDNLRRDAVFIDLIVREDLRDLFPDPFPISCDNLRIPLLHLADQAVHAIQLFKEISFQVPAFCLSRRDKLFQCAIQRLSEHVPDDLLIELPLAEREDSIQTTKSGDRQIIPQAKPLFQLPVGIHILLRQLFIQLQAQICFPELLTCHRDFHFPAADVLLQLCPHQGLQKCIFLRHPNTGIKVPVIDGPDLDRKLQLAVRTLRTAEPCHTSDHGIPVPSEFRHQVII